jgi:hypothetical protein
MEGARNIAISGMDLGGGLYTGGYGERMASQIEGKIGQPVDYVTNPSGLFGLGSLLHSVLGELGVTFTPSIYLAQAIRGGAQNMYAHSQGVLVVEGAVGGLITDSQRSQLHMQTFGGEIQRDSASWGFDVKNTVNSSDAVPRLSPRNIFGGAWAGFYNPVSQGFGQHGMGSYINQIQSF